jgi:hypothetical protein
LLHFNYEPTSVEDPAIAAEAEKVKIYAYNKAVYISDYDNNYTPAKVTIYDMYGRQIYFTEMQLSNMTRIPVLVNNSYLVVKVTRGSETYTQKVFVQ